MNIFKNYSKSSDKKGKSTRGPNPQIIKPTTLVISKSELGNMLEDMNIESNHSPIIDGYNAVKNEKRGI